MPDERHGRERHDAVADHAEADGQRQRQLCHALAAEPKQQCLTHHSLQLKAQLHSNPDSPTSYQNMKQMLPVELRKERVATARPGRRMRRVCTGNWYTMSKQSGNECKARMEDEASVYAYSGRAL